MNADPAALIRFLTAEAAHIVESWPKLPSNAASVRFRAMKMICVSNVLSRRLYLMTLTGLRFMIFI